MYTRGMSNNDNKRGLTPLERNLLTALEGMVSQANYQTCDGQIYDRASSLIDDIKEWLNPRRPTKAQLEAHDRAVAAMGGDDRC